MNILVIGSGGREHAIINSISKSKKCSKIYALPGNGGTELLADNIEGDVNDFELIKKITLKHKVSLVFVGPEDPIVNGIYDFFKSNIELKDVNIIAPSKQAGLLEGSKDFAKDFMEKYNIPTAKHKTFSIENINQADSFLESMNPPYVLKADGLAAGKGVLILKNLDEAKLELRNMILDKKFGDSSTKVVIEEFLDGIELSCFILTDGENYKVLPFAKDYKKIGEGDTGLNTGGMGAISPVPFLDDDFLSKIQNKIIKPTITGIIKENMKYNGFVFIGLIKVDDEPYVIEYNVRMGDPETEVVFPRLKNDLVELFYSMGTPKFSDIKLNISDNHAATVILVSGGYPESYEKGKTINGLNNLSEVSVFHAGTKKKNDSFVTSGGRVLAITSMGKNFALALENSYDQIKNIKFDGMNYRNDIGFDLL
jgi:phosphoribosylamine--glycine ligase